MKKTICIFLCICLILTFFCGCSKQNDIQSEYSEEVITEEIIIDNTTNGSNNAQGDDNMSSIADTPSTSEVPAASDDASSKIDSENCSHKYDEQIEQKAELFKAGTKKYVCKSCGDSYTKEYPIEKLKLLSISNSYGKNALWELPEICKQTGVENVDVAVMYIAGCSLDQHWENIQNNNAVYEVFRNNNGSWTSTQNCTIDSLLTEGDWDIITTQNSSGLSGRTDGYKNLNNVADYIKGKCPNSKLVWHLIWGYQNGSKWLTPDNYNGDEKFMYESIVNCTNDIVIPSGKFDSVVPVGAAIMNARTSKLKDSVHEEDGSHLSEDVGYYIGAFTWFGHLTGMSVYEINLAAINFTASKNVDVICESAENALKNPYEITQSYYKN